jgi:hypothetical protein
VTAGRCFGRRAALVAALCACGVAKAQTVPVVEYYHPGLDHFFGTALAAEIAALDGGQIAGWRRTGQAFGAYPTNVVSSSPVCRFYIPPEHGNSHFFSASPAECAAVLQKIDTDASFSGYVHETASAWYIGLPDPVTGGCLAGGVPVWRLWNQRADSNHRYATSAAVRDPMLALGFVAEGYGPDAVAMCAPALAPTATYATVTAASPYAGGCDGTSLGVVYAGAEVEPSVAVNPTDPANIVGVWQQDRSSTGGARGLATAASHDGGRTWTRSAAPPFTRCGGGNAANNGDYVRASDPWVSFGADGTAWQIALALNGSWPLPDSNNAILVSNSTDGGASWSTPTVLIRDEGPYLNDKESITADPHDSRYVYAVWDRLDSAGSGPTYFARTTDGGASWEPPRRIYDPGGTAQTINNQLVVLPDGTLVVLFTRLPTTIPQSVTPAMLVLRSTDRGVTWSAPISVATVQSVGTADAKSGRLVRDGANLGSIAAGPRGELAVVWQDARFSGGAVDDIAFARSDDGGRSWSAPVRINGAPGARAFVPVAHIRVDGVVGVGYYDLRNDLPDARTLPADLWLTESGDGVAWRETHIDGPFDLMAAPNARGLFLGDYMGLASVGNRFVPFYARTNAQPAGNATDVYAALAAQVDSGIAAPTRRSSETPASVPSATVRATSAPPLQPTGALARRLAASVDATRLRRLPGATGVPAP